MNPRDLARSVAFLVLTAVAFAQDFTGTWQGTSQGPRGEFRLVIKISKGDGGALKAMLYSIDQSAVGNPGSMTVEGSNVKMAIPGSNLTFDGKLSADKLSIAGTWSRNGTPMSCILKHVAEDAAWDTQKLKFDVASIKPSGSGVKRVAEVRPLPGGRISATYMAVNNLIQVAFRVRPYQISGGPAWLESDPYDIEAKPDNPAAAGAWQGMLQALLVERFKLKFHRETKELPIYSLVLARKDGALGANLTKAKEGSCADPNQPAAGKPACGFRTGRDHLTGFGEPIGALADALSRILGRSVVDHTGLTAKFDFSVKYADDASGASLFTALQEQLGLKLEAQKGPVEMFIIDGAQRPAEN